MRLPSVKTLRTITDKCPNDPDTTARALREVLEIWERSHKEKAMVESSISMPLTAFVDARSPLVKAIAKSIKHDRMSRTARALAICDQLLGTCGVESIHEGQDNWPSYSEGPAYLIEYCNAGDSYALTLMHVRVKGKGTWRVGSWGDLVEQWEHRGIDFA